MKHPKKLVAALASLVMTVAIAAAGTVPTQAAAPAQAAAYASASMPGRVDITNVRVEHITAHAATVKFDWAIEGVDIDRIANVCFIVDVNRITEMTPIAYNPADFATYPYDLPCTDGSNDESGSSDANNNANDNANTGEDDGIYDVQSRELSLPNADGSLYKAATYTGQQFYRYSDDWNRKSLGGAAVVTLDGLAENTAYGNTDNTGGHVALDPNPLWPLLNQFESLWNKGVRGSTKVDVRTLYAGVRVESAGQEWSSRFSAAKVPDFTTLKSSGGSEPDNPEPSSARIPVYRVYNPGLPASAQHLYTTSTAEYADLITHHGWLGEGVQFYVPAAGKTGKTNKGNSTRPVHRLYNPYTGAHFFTADDHEYKALRGSWRDEGVAWHVDDDGDAIVLRGYNAATGEHLYTIDQHEMDTMAANGWIQEMSAFKAYSRMS